MDCKVKVKLGRICWTDDIMNCKQIGETFIQQWSEKGRVMIILWELLIKSINNLVGVIFESLVDFIFFAYSIELI